MWIKNQKLVKLILGKLGKIKRLFQFFKVFNFVAIQALSTFFGSKKSLWWKN